MFVLVVIVLHITDANGCSSAIINGGNNQVVVPFALSTTASIDFSSVVNVLCNSSATGSASALNPITNNTNYSYSWENVNNPGVTVSGYYSIKLNCWYLCFISTLF